MKLEHKGRWFYRLNPLADNPRERVFAEQWAKENAPHGSVNQGRGVCEMLLGVDVNGNYHRDVTQAEATAMATVVQWLGSNVGWGFMDDCIRKCGYQLKRNP